MTDVTQSASAAADDPHPRGRSGPEVYGEWRTSSLGAITDALEYRLLFRLIGDLRGLAMLDVGCGDGSWAIACWQRGAARVTGCDTDPCMVERALASAAAAEVPLHALAGDAEALPFADASFDLVSVITVLAFVREPHVAVREMSRVLRPGGRIIIGDLGRWSLWAARRRIRGWLGSATWRAARFRSAGDLRNLTENAGLRMEHMAGAIYFPPIAVLARLMAPIDLELGEVTTIGGAFIALSARKPREPTIIKAPRSSSP